MLKIIKKRSGTNGLIKGLIRYFFDISFKINCYVDKMLLEKKEKKRKLIYYKISRKFHCFVSYKLIAGNNFTIVHPFGVVIGGAQIGDNCRIYQNVTIGQKDGVFPKIGDNVTIYSGAVLIGDITIGDDSVIGANAFVNKSFPKCSVIVGVPGKNINQKED